MQTSRRAMTMGADGVKTCDWVMSIGPDRDSVTIMTAQSVRTSVCRLTADELAAFA